MLTLEQLLNKLIEKGWKPFGSDYGRYEHGCLIHEFTTKDGVYSYGQYPTTLREFCAKESGLWQFVCENRMTKKMEKIPRGIWINSWHKSAYEKCPVYTMEKAEYRIIESALCNEKDLEKFLLENIKIS